MQDAGCRIQDTGYRLYPSERERQKTPGLQVLESSYGLERIRYIFERVSLSIKTMVLISN